LNAHYEELTPIKQIALVLVSVGATGKVGASAGVTGVGVIITGAGVVVTDAGVDEGVGVGGVGGNSPPSLPDGETVWTP
jgi:hypothetical protein